MTLLDSTASVTLLDATADTVLEGLGSCSNVRAAGVPLRV